MFRPETEWGWSPSNTNSDQPVSLLEDPNNVLQIGSNLYTSPQILRYPQPIKSNTPSIRGPSQLSTTLQSQSGSLSTGWQRTNLPAAPSSFLSSGGAGIGRIAAVTSVVDPRAAELRAQLAQLDARIENLQSAKNWNLQTLSLESNTSSSSSSSQVRKFGGGLIGAASTLNGALDAFSNGFIGDTEELSAVSLARYSSLMPLSVAKKSDASQNDTLSYSLQGKGASTSVLVSPFKGQSEPFTSAALKSSSLSSLSSRRALRATQARVDLVRVIFLRANRDRIIKAIRRWVRRSNGRRQVKAIARKEAHAKALKRAKELLKGVCCRFLFRKMKKTFMLSKTNEEMAKEMKREEEHWRISSKFDRRLDAAIAKHASSRSNEDAFQYDLLRHSSVAASVYNSTAAKFAPLSLLPDQNVVLAATTAATSILSLTTATERYGAAVTEAVKDRARSMIKTNDDVPLPDFIAKPNTTKAQKLISPKIPENNNLLSKIISHRVEPKPVKSTPATKTPVPSTSSNISSLSKQLRERQSPDKLSSSQLSIVLSNAVPGVSQLPIPPLPLSLAFSKEDERKTALEQIAAAEQILFTPTSSLSIVANDISLASRSKISSIDAEHVSNLRSGIAAAVLLTPLNKQPSSSGTGKSPLTTELGHSGYLDEVLASIAKKNSLQQQQYGGDHESLLGSPKQQQFSLEQQQQQEQIKVKSEEIFSPKVPIRKAPSIPKGRDAVNGLIDKVLDELDF